MLASRVVGAVLCVWQRLLIDLSIGCHEETSPLFVLLFRLLHSTKNSLLKPTETTRFDETDLVRFDEASKQTEERVGVRLPLAKVFDALLERVLRRLRVAPQPPQLLFGVCQEIFEHDALLLVLEVFPQLVLFPRQLHAFVQLLDVRQHVLQ